VAFEYGGGRVAELDHLYTELNTVIPELAPPQWPELRAAIVRLVEGHVANLGTQYTLDWAYDCWQRAKDRPEQTDDEARRFLDDFMASARVSTLAEVRRSHILKWRKSLQDAGKLAPKSINQRLELVAAILRTGWRDAEMQPVDLQKINVPEPTDSPRSKWGKGHLLEASHALALPDEPEWARWLYVIALTTGTRIGEPVAARREWYDPLGFIDAPKSATKKRKYHVMPIIELIREPLERHVAALQPGEYLFPEAPRPGNPKLKISHEVSKWFSRFRERHGIPKVVHELRHTFKEAARASPIKKEIHDIITGHSPATEADKYGGAEPSELLAASEIICAKFLDAELVTAIKRLFI
jgi:integrase